MIIFALIKSTIDSIDNDCRCESSVARLHTCEFQCVDEGYAKVGLQLQNYLGHKCNSHVRPAPLGRKCHHNGISCEHYGEYETQLVKIFLEC